MTAPGRQLKFKLKHDQPVDERQQCYWGRRDQSLSNRPYRLCRRHDRNLLKHFEREQVFVAGDNEIGLGGQGACQHLR